MALNRQGAAQLLGRKYVKTSQINLKLLALSTERDNPKLKKMRSILNNVHNGKY